MCVKDVVFVPLLVSGKHFFIRKKKENKEFFLRYKCKECRDFDLCSQCMFNSLHDHHQFLQVRNPTENSYELCGDVHEGITCDACNSPIIGHRFDLLKMLESAYFYF